MNSVVIDPFPILRFKLFCTDGVSSYKYLVMSVNMFLLVDY